MGPKFWSQKFSQVILYWCYVVRFFDLLARIRTLFSDWRAISFLMIPATKIALNSLNKVQILANKLKNLIK